MRATLLLAALFLASPARAALTPRPAAQVPDSLFMMDLQDFDGDGKNVTVNAQIISTLARNGMKWARVRPNWPTVESTAGVYVSSGVDNMVANCRANGVSMLMVLETNLTQPLYAGGAAPTNSNGAMTPWLDYVDYTVRRYKDSVAAWEVWNEPNLNGYPNDAAGYAVLLQKTAQKIRSIVPDAYIVANVSFVDVPYIQAFLPTTGSLINAVSVHPYRQYPEQPQDSFGALDSKIAHNGAADYEGEIAQLRAALTSAGYPNLDIWATETGYPSQNEDGGVWTGSLTMQQKNMARYYLLNLKLGLKHADWFKSADIDGLTSNMRTPPTSGFINDYRNENMLFATMGPLYFPQGASTAWPATTRTSDANVSVAGGTVTATAPLPTAFTVHSIPITQTSDYQIWLRMGGAAPATPAIVFCEVNGVQTYTFAGDVYYSAAINSPSAAAQGSTDYSKFYWGPCIYSAAGGGVPITAPVRWHFNAGDTLTLKLYPMNNSSYSEIRLEPIGSLTEKPAMTTLRTLAALFDDRVGAAPSLGASFSQGTLSGPEWAGFRSAAYTTRGGVPVIAYWTGAAAPVDSFADRAASVHVSAPIPDAVLVDPLTGSYTSVSPDPSNTFSVRVQDYPLILTSLSALDKSGGQLLLAEETYNYPNPARGDTTYLRFYLTQASHVKLEIFNAAHARVYESSLDAPAGKTAVPWRLGGVADGVYFLKVSAGGQSVVKKIVILR